MHVLNVRGAAVASGVEARSLIDDDAALEYTHSGNSPSLCHCLRAHSPPSGPPLSVALLCPQLVADQQQICSTICQSMRVRGGSWMITTSPAPLMLLPENDVAEEAASSFPSLIAPNGLAFSRADGSSNMFTGLFVGCAVISSRDEASFPSPWPLDMSSSKHFS